MTEIEVHAPEKLCRVVAVPQERLVLMRNISVRAQVPEELVVNVGAYQLGTKTSECRHVQDRAAIEYGLGNATEKTIVVIRDERHSQPVSRMERRIPVQH